MTPRLRLALLAAPLVAAGIPAVARAEDAAPPAPPASEPPPAEPAPPPEVRVIGNKPDALQRVPGSGTILGEKEVQRAEPVDTAEMLRRVPGVQVNQDYGGGGRLDIGVRGLDPGRSRHVLVLEDGVPVSLNPYAEPDLYYAPPIERMRAIEVVKGSGSILFGPQTIGGVVNFITIAPPTRQRVVADVEGGQYGYARGLASYGDTFGRARYVVQALYRRGDGFRDEPFESTDALGKIAFDTSDTGEATLKLGFHDDAAVSGDVGLTRDMYARDPRRATFTPDDKLHLRRYDVSLTHDQRLGRDVKLKTLLYAYDTNRIWNRQDYVRAGFPGQTYDHIVGDTSLPSGAIYFFPTDTILDRDYQVAGVEPRVTHDFDTGPAHHTMDYGARLLGETAHYQQRSGENPTSVSGALAAEEKHRTLAVAAYAQDRIAFTDALLVTPGLRVEHAAFHRVLLRQDTGDGVHDVSIPGDTQSTGVIPGIGLVYGTRSAHVFGGLHLGWAPPRITASIAPKGQPTQVNAEQSTNWEIGARVSPKKWLKTEATGFVTEFQNQVVINTAAGSAADVASEIDAGETRHYGVELAATAQLGRALGWPTALDLGARYTYAHASFVGGAYAGHLLPYAPPHALTAYADVERAVGFGAFGAELAWSHVGAQFTDAANTVAEDATGRIGLLPAHDIVDAVARVKHASSGLSARLVVKNALDATYVYARRPEGIFAGNFRQIMLGVRWEWEREPPSPP